MLRLATKFYPLVNTRIILNTVNNLSESISKTVDESITPRTSATNALVCIVANHGLSIFFRMIGGAIRPLGHVFRYPSNVVIALFKALVSPITGFVQTF